MKALYNFGIALYELAVRIAAKRSPKPRKMIEGQRDTDEILRRQLTGKPAPVWFHASSLGEFEQGRPMIERLKREQPDRPVLLSFFSPSGYEVRKNFPLADAVVYLPFDRQAYVRRFLDEAKPSMAIFIKYEFWNNYLEELNRRQIPAYIISAIFRPGQRFFKWWGGFFRRTLQKFTHLYVQDDRSLQLLDSVGIKNVTVAGDTRFDRVTDVMRSQVEIPGFPGFGAGSPMRVIFGSSWPADEEVYLSWLRRHPEVSFIIAPHEFDAERLETLRRECGTANTAKTTGKPADKAANKTADVFLLSEWIAAVTENGGKIPAELAGTRGIIVDSFGKLASLYRFADVAYVGGGFGTGIHNINEAAVYGMPVIFGPHHQKFNEAAGLMEAGGGFCVCGADDFEKQADTLLSSADERKEAGRAAAAFIKSHLGATEAIFNDIFRAHKP